MQVFYPTVYHDLHLTSQGVARLFNGQLGKGLIKLAILLSQFCSCHNIASQNRLATLFAPSKWGGLSERLMCYGDFVVPEKLVPIFN
jgi:hypothetical protein